MCFNNFTSKVLNCVASNTSQSEANDNNLVNFSERELIYNMLRALALLPSDLVIQGFNSLKDYALRQMSSDSLYIVK